MKKHKRLVVTTLVTLIVILALLIIISKTNLRKLFSNVTGNIGYESREIEYNNEGKGLESSNMQDAIDELYAKCLQLKNECPEGFECIKKSDLELKTELKKLIDTLNEKLPTIEDEKEKEEIVNLINETKNIIYEDNYEKFSEYKDKINEKLK